VLLSLRDLNFGHRELGGAKRCGDDRHIERRYARIADDGCANRVTTDHRPDASPDSGEPTGADHDRIGTIAEGDVDLVHDPTSRIFPLAGFGYPPATRQWRL